MTEITKGEAIRSPTEFYTFQEKVAEISCVKGTVLDLGGSQRSLFIIACTLTKCSFMNMARDWGNYWLSLVIYIVIAICIETIYFKPGYIMQLNSGTIFKNCYLTQVFRREGFNGPDRSAAFVISRIQWHCLKHFPFCHYRQGLFLALPGSVLQ